MSGVLVFEEKLFKGLTLAISHCPLPGTKKKVQGTKQRGSSFLEQSRLPVEALLELVLQAASLTIPGTIEGRGDDLKGQ